MSKASQPSRAPRAGKTFSGLGGAELGKLTRDLAERQLANDTERTKAFPDLLGRKLERMSASPLAFLRGAAPLFYELLANDADLAEGPPGAGFIVGDLHLENFGAYRPDGFNDPEASAAKRPAIFNLNDFDDTIVGPWRLDVLRCTTSMLLAGRELGATGIVALELLDHMLDAWNHAAFDGKAPPEPPPCVAALIEKVRSRSPGALLDARTKETHGKRHFVRGPRYADLDKAVLDQVPAAFEEYIASVPVAEQPHRGKGALDILDAALRIAGTGSLGGLRIAVLVQGKGGSHGNWIFDLKEQGSPSAAVLLGEPELEPALRVVSGFRACIEHPQSTLGTTHIVHGKEKISLSGRRLSPQEDKLNLTKLPSVELPALATYLGALLGMAHARAATEKPKSAWSKADRATIRAQAITLAGVHEAVYLALCERTRAIL